MTRQIWLSIDSKNINPGVYYSEAPLSKLGGFWNQQLAGYYAASKQLLGGWPPPKNPCLAGCHSSHKQACGLSGIECKTCGTRFSERQGSLMQYTKLPQADVVRIVKCCVWQDNHAAISLVCSLIPSANRTPRITSSNSLLPLSLRQ